MKFLADTNVLSELSKPRPHPRVARWFQENAPSDVCFSVITLGEIEKGLHSMDAGRRLDDLTLWIKEVHEQYKDQFLPVNNAVAREWGRLSARHIQLSTADGLIAATAVVHDLILVTRDADDFRFLRRPVVNPFDTA